MASLPQLKASGSNAGVMPFASYAQVLRMLMPPVFRVGFYDAKGRALWVSDGVEEPEFRMHLDLVLARFAAHGEDEGSGPYGSTEQPEPIFVFPIRDASHTLLGALGLICRELPATAAYRRLEHVERLLAPILQILSHAWRQTMSVPGPKQDTKATQAATPPAKPADPSTPLPAILRRTLALATRSLNCSFGAIIAVERPFTLNHRVSPDESDLAINAAIDNVRTTVLRHMQVRQEPLVSNTSGEGRAFQLPYKLLALPLRAGPSALAAVMIVFRDKREADFDASDLVALAQIAAQIPALALRELLAPRASTPVKAPAAAAESKAARAPSAPTPAAPPPRAAAVKARAKAPAPARSSTPTPPAAPSKVVRFAGMHSEMPMEERIRLALRQNAFDLYAQRIAPLKDTNRPQRYEVLLRMNDGNALYTPQAFFGAAEAHELMPELDQWVIRELMSALKQRAVALRTSCWEFAVNVSAQTLLTDSFSEYVIDELKHSSIPAGSLVFEIAESDAVEHQYSLSILARRLHNVGCRIALDNCRSGLRTYDAVYRSPVSCLKIDGSLIRHIASNCRYESQVRGMARMAAEMGLETVAECVETESIRERLLAMDIDYAQGYHFGRPEPLDTLFAV